MSNKKLADFLKELAQDPDLKARYVKNPRGVMTEKGVEPAHQELIMSGDNAGLQRALGGNPGNVATTTVKSFKD